MQFSDRYSFMNNPIKFGNFELSHRLIQGPLAGFSCAPFRQSFTPFTPPAYAVSEMLSAHDVVYKHKSDGRYLYRSPKENHLCYQISGSDPVIMAEAAIKLESLHADLIDINCGCPKLKIRKKGAGSALLDQPERLIQIIRSVRRAIKIPLTVKIRLQGDQRDIELARTIAAEGADALIIHGRRWVDDYDQPCNLNQVAQIKREIAIPVVANGDIACRESLIHVMNHTQCDAFMISRASTGKPWLFQQLLGQSVSVTVQQKINLFMTHLQALADLEDEYKAILQSKSLVRYYFKDNINCNFLNHYYGLKQLKEIEIALKRLLY